MAQPGTDTRLQSILAKTGGRADFPAAAEIIQQFHAAVKRENCAALDVVRLIGSEYVKYLGSYLRIMLALADSAPEPPRVEKSLASK